MDRHIIRSGIASVFCVLIIACAAKSTRHELDHSANPPPTESAASADNAAHTPAPTPVATAPAAQEHARHAGPVPYETSLRWLKNGNTRFVKGNIRKDGQSKADIKKLSQGQQPHAIVLSCSDSRVPPEVLFDQKLGEIFVVRTAGESLASPVIGSIEYAVSHLGSNLIVVMGHTSCGAVKAAYSTLNGGDAGSQWLNRMLADIHPRIKPIAGSAPSPNYVEESWANVSGVAKDLMQRSKIIQDAVASGSVKIAEALYDLETGRVNWH